MLRLILILFSSPRVGFANGLSPSQFPSKQHVFYPSPQEGPCSDPNTSHLLVTRIIYCTNINREHAAGGAVGWCTALQTGRSRVRFPLVSLEIFIDIKSFRSHYGPGVDSASNRNEYQEYFLGGKAGRCVEADKLTTFMCQFSWNLGASTYWKTEGLSRPVMGLLYLYLYLYLYLLPIVITKSVS